MGKIKLYDVAKELNLTSKEVLEIAKKLNIEAKSHLSSIDEEDANKIKESAKNLTAKKPEKKMNQEKAKKEEKNDSPVIIRREVIINDEANVQKEQVKKEEKKNNHVGFVERKQNKDYNIVYRNKPSKPMTVDELFGIKKEPKKALELLEKACHNNDAEGCMLIGILYNNGEGVSQNHRKAAEIPNT